MVPGVWDQDDSSRENWPFLHKENFKMFCRPGKHLAAWRRLFRSAALLTQEIYTWPNLVWQWSLFNLPKQARQLNILILDWHHNLWRGSRARYECNLGFYSGSEPPMFVPVLWLEMSVIDRSAPVLKKDQKIFANLTPNLILQCPSCKKDDKSAPSTGMLMTTAPLIQLAH